MFRFQKFARIDLAGSVSPSIAYVTRDELALASVTVAEVDRSSE